MMNSRLKMISPTRRTVRTLRIPGDNGAILKKVIAILQYVLSNSLPSADYLPVFSKCTFSHQNQLVRESKFIFHANFSSRGGAPWYDWAYFSFPWLSYTKESDYESKVPSDKVEEDPFGVPCQILSFFYAPKEATIPSFIAEETYKYIKQSNPPASHTGYSIYAVVRPVERAIFDDPPDENIDNYLANQVTEILFWSRSMVETDGSPSLWIIPFPDIYYKRPCISVPYDLDMDIEKSTEWIFVMPKWKVWDGLLDNEMKQRIEFYNQKKRGKRKKRSDDS